MKQKIFMLHYRALRGLFDSFYDGNIIKEAFKISLEVHVCCDLFSLNKKVRLQEMPRNFEWNKRFDDDR